MSLILQQKKIIEKLLSENHALRVQNESTETDIKTLASSFKKAWGSLDIDLEKFKSKNKFTAITAIVSKLAKKEVQTTLEAEWEVVSEMLKKYNHLTLEE